MKKTSDDIDYDNCEQVDKTCSILCLDVPNGSIFGIDYQQYQCGPLFKGIKLVPAGIHFIFFSSSSGSGEGSMRMNVLRSGFFVILQPGDIIVRRFNSQKEELCEIDDKSEEERFIAAVERFEFHQFLGNYQHETFQDWKALSCFITKPVLCKLEPLDKRILSTDEISGDNDNDPQMKQLDELLSQTRKSLSFNRRKQNKINGNERNMNDELKSIGYDMEAISSGKKAPTETSTEYSETISEITHHHPFYSNIPKQRKVTGHSLNRSEVTRQNFDKSSILMDILKQYSDPNEIIGELQFSFICFLMGQSYSAFMQWKRILGVLCCCEEALHQIPALFNNFIVAFRSQLVKFPREMFEEISSTTDNFLRIFLKGFFELVDDPSLEIRLQEEARKLHQVVLSQFGDEFIKANSFDEDAPVIVTDESSMIIDETKDRKEAWE